MSKVQITPEMLDQLDYSLEEISLNNVKSSVAVLQDAASPTVMFIFSNSDLNAAAYHLAKSLEPPFKNNSVITLIVQESVRKNFLSIVQSKLKAFEANVERSSSFLQAINQIIKLKVQTFSAPDADISACNYPVLVADVTHEQLGPSVTNGIITVHTFRTVKEAIALCAKESVSFTNANIWNENHSCAYELVAALQSQNFFINCFDVSLEPLKKYIQENKSYVTIHKSYHYETLLLEGKQKSVIFPIGTIFAN